MCSGFSGLVEIVLFAGLMLPQCHGMSVWPVLVSFKGYAQFIRKHCKIFKAAIQQRETIIVDVKTTIKYYNH